MEPTRTLAATAPARASGETTIPQPDPGRGGRVGNPGEAAYTADSELQSLLRKRFRFIGVLLSGVHLVFSVLRLAGWINHPPSSVLDCLSTVVYLAVTVVILLMTVIVWSRFPLPVAQLRTLELGFTGLIVVHHAFQFLWAHFSVVPYQRDPEVAFVSLDLFYDLNSFALVVGYGVLIPNTGRRCARVVAVLAILPVLVRLALGLELSDGWRPQGMQIFWITLYSLVYMSIASAIAVYGSHRIETLRQEASAARKLGQYVLREKLGGGGMGEVYRADHALLRRPAAIKLIRPDRAGEPANLARFEREVQATATLTHPNTVQIYDYGRAEDGTFYYVMEYLPGFTLDELVGRDGPLTPVRAVQFLRQLCGALREAHQIGLIHRDLKPGNIMVCNRGGNADTVKLLDFGLVLPTAGSTDAKLTYDGFVTGTPAYLSPEQASGTGALDARSDIYSLGAVAYFLLTGRPPFSNCSPMKMIAAHLYEPPAPPSRHRSDLPADLEAVVLKCLAKVPADRFVDVEALDAALAGCHVEVNSE